MFENYYNILGVSDKASSREIKRAYRELAKKYHPDKHKGNLNYEEKFKRISMAYDTLSDPEKKITYDLKRDYYKFQPQEEYSEEVKDTGWVKRESTVYESKKREYTPNAWMYGKIVIFLIIMAAILIPYGLFHYTSVYNYNKGVEYEAEGDFQRAYSFYIKAIGLWGSRNFEAAYGAGKVLMENGAASQSIQYFREAFEYTNSDSVESLLNFKIGQAMAEASDYNDALDQLETIDPASIMKDSALLLSAEIRTFRTSDFRGGIQKYQELIAKGVKLKESWFGVGWCNQNLFRYPEAVEAYNNCLEQDPMYAMAVYYRGAAHYYSSDSISACIDFIRARELGYPMASLAFDQNCTDELKTFVPPNENL